MATTASGSPKIGCCVHLESSTWARERGDLYDFEADPSSEGSRISSQDFLVLDSAACVRNGANVQLLPRDQVHLSTTTGSEHLVSLVRKNDSLWIHQGADMVPGGLRPSLVVKDMPDGTHWLRGGETIRLGCARIRVRQVVTSGPALVRPSLKIDGEGPPCCANPESKEIMAGSACRICMLEGPNEDDPLISPCACKGSVEYVHLACLREWIRVRRNLPPAGEASDRFAFYSLKCDLCKGPYASAVKYTSESPYKERYEPLADIPMVQPPFVVFEVPGRHHGGGGRRSHVLSLAGDAEKVLKLGRAHNCDLRIPDASISRWHASIRIDGAGKMVLEDHESKFGTLVEVQRPIAVDPKTALSLQVGRTVLRLTPADVPFPMSQESASAPTSATSVGEAPPRRSCTVRGPNVQEL